MSLRRPLAVSLTLTVLAVSSAAGAHGIDEVQEELGEAARSLEEIESALAAAERDIEAAEARLGEATLALEAVEEELARAKRAAEEAEEIRLDRAEQLLRAQRDVDAADDALAAALDRLHDRSVEVYKYGTGRPQQALVTGVMGATDWHEVAVTTSTVSRIVADDRALFAEAAEARETAERVRSDATDAKLAALVAEEQALAEQAKLRDIVEEHEAAVAAVAEEHRRRESVLASLEEDSELAALLVATLEDQIARALAKRAAEEAASQRAAEEAAAEAERADEEAAAQQVEPEPEPREDETASDAPDPADPADPPDPRADESVADAAPAWAVELPAAGRPWAARIDAAARANGIDGRLFAALVWTESHFRPDAQSWVGAIGLAQLMPGTAASLGVDPWDPIQNLDGGARYLAMQHQTFGSVELALAAYNAGPTAVRAAGPGIPNYLETQLYVVRVLERYNHLAG